MVRTRQQALRDSRRSRGRSNTRDEEQPLAIPEIVVNHELPRMVDEVVSAVLAKPELSIYQRERLLVRPVRAVRDGQGPIQRRRGTLFIEQFPEAAVLEACCLAASWLKYDGRIKGYKHILPPPVVVAALCARGGWPFPVLRAVTEAPTLRPDGTILAVPGYDPETGILFDPAGVEFPAVPEAPSPDEVAEALGLLREPFREFPWVGPEDESALLAAVLSILGRQAIDGPVPIFGVCAPTPGTGKTFAVQLVGMIATGREFPVLTPDRSREETRKLLLSLAIEGASAILIDNVDGPFGNAELAAAMTSNRIKDRLLGANRTIEGELRAVWFATGNGLRWRGDLGRRVIPINLDARVEDPESRSFRRPGNALRDWVLDHRPALVSAGLKILRGYIAAGRPPHDEAPMGSFENWDSLVRGAILYAGLPDPCAGRQAVRLEADSDLEALRELFACWRDRYGDAAHPLAKVIKDAKDDEDLEAALAPFDPTGKLDARRIGNRFRNVKGRIVNGYFLSSTEISGRAHWRVAPEAELHG